MLVTFTVSAIQGADLQHTVLLFIIFFTFSQYVWRVPVNEIDRPGSFCYHNNRSIALLLSVLQELADYPLLLHVSAFLHKTPDKER